MSEAKAKYIIYWRFPGPNPHWNCSEFVSEAIADVFCSALKVAGAEFRREEEE